MHWSRVIETCVSLSLIAGGISAVYFPVRIRREERRAASLVAAVSPIVESAIRDGLADVCNAVDALGQRATETERRLDVQFGGNGNGLRQAVNEQGRQLARLTGRLDEHLRKVSA